MGLSTELTSPIKAPINNLLTSLCRLNSDWFVEAMETARRCLVGGSSAGTGRARVLQTLAHCSLSDECIHVLLRSSTITLVMNSLRNSLQSLDSTQPGSHTSILDLICSDVAFLTSLAFGHSVAQEWLVQEENAFFWPDLLRCFDEPSSSFSVEDLSFCQHTVQQFFAVCIKFSEKGKRLFTNLLVNALLGRYSLEPVSDITGPCNFRLTPFTRTLVIDHILGPEAVHVIVEITPDIMRSTNQQKMSTTPLISTYDSPHYHPSYPIDSNHYYLKLSSENTLGRILYLIGFEERVTARAKTSEQAKPKKVPDTPKTKPPFATPTADGNSKPFLNIFDCKFLKSPEQTGINGVYFTTLGKPQLHPMTSTIKTKQIPTSDGYGCSQTRMVSVKSGMISGSRQRPGMSVPQGYVSMLDVFAESVGLKVLAKIFSYLYPSLRPATIESHSVDISLLPPLTRASFLPPHSYVMFCLCLRLREYGNLICSSSMTGNVWYLLRGALGATRESKTTITYDYLFLLNCFFFCCFQLRSSYLIH